LVKMLWSDWVTFSAIPSGDRPNHQHRQETNTRITKKALCVFHRPLHFADMNSWDG
jgi:hypothetical protein